MRYNNEHERDTWLFKCPEGRADHVSAREALHGRRLDCGARPTRAVLLRTLGVVDIPLLLLVRQTGGHVRQIPAAGECHVVNHYSSTCCFQAYFNFRRKSTRGWSILMIYMDCTGGVTALLQMLFIAFNFDDWKTIFGNFAKFGLSAASICYDVLFFLQEYVFYRQTETRKSVSSEQIVADFKQKASKRKSIISVISVKSRETIKQGFNYGFGGENLVWSRDLWSQNA